ncbi:MAG: hypothetical protein ACMUHX_11570 [bacterium]
MSSTIIIIIRAYIKPDGMVKSPYSRLRIIFALLNTHFGCADLTV